MVEPAYSFSTPSLHDQTPLDCRIYLPKQVQAVLARAHDTRCIRSAIVAHPYAPLGGCFDDAVVLSVAQILLGEGYVVGTFNFRGATGSPGSTSLTGKAEQADYETFAGFIIAYCRSLLSTRNPDEKNGHQEHQLPVTEQRQDKYIEMLFAGYSYGSLILARLPKVSDIAQRFCQTSLGSVEEKITSQASILAGETRRNAMPSHPDGVRSSTSVKDDGAPHSRASTITIGDEQTGHSSKRLSRDRKRSGTKIKVARGRHAHDLHMIGHERHDTFEPSTSDVNQWETTISARYLLISPVVLPFTHSLCPPGAPSLMSGLGKLTAASSLGSPFLEHPTLVVFGSKDAFTSSHRLRGWAERQTNETLSTFEFAEIEAAGHFWSEEGVMQVLQRKVVSWLNSLPQK